jgi:hypothetical protein
LASGLRPHSAEVEVFAEKSEVAHWALAEHHRLDTFFGSEANCHSYERFWEAPILADEDPLTMVIFLSGGTKKETIRMFINAVTIDVPSFSVWAQFGHRKTHPKMRLFCKLLILLVPGGGVEPPRGCPRRILSPLRLPVPPSRLG